MHGKFGNDLVGTWPVGAPTEAWLFAQSLLGKPASTASWKAANAATDHSDVRRQAHHQSNTQVSESAQGAYWEWLAAISGMHESQFSGPSSAAAHAGVSPGCLSWLAEISTAHVVEWDPAKHPRAGTVPNPGWFADKSGGASQPAARPKSQPLPPRVAERVADNIKGRSGYKWSGDRVLDVMSTLSPDWLRFVQQYVTLVRASNNAKVASTTVRSGEYGPELSKLPSKPLNELGPLTVHFDIPDGWNDIQVAQYMLTQIADDVDVHRIAAHWAANKPDLFKQITDQRFRNGLPTIAAIANGYYSAIASLNLGGQAVVAAWDIQEGNNLGAAMGAVFMLPLGKIAKAGLEATGTIAISAGNKLLAVLPAKAIQRIESLAPEQKALLNLRLLAAETKEEAAEILEKFLAIPFDRHHPLPKFLGGELEQSLLRIPKEAHKEFHALLREELRAAGFKLNIGGTGGSTSDWLKLLAQNAGAQGKAFDAVLTSSHAIDTKHGTKITQWVWHNLVGERFLIMP